MLHCYKTVNPLTGQPLFEGKSAIAVLKNIISLVGVCPSHVKALREKSRSEFQGIDTTVFSSDDMSLLKKK
jgi:hypothetical protein